MMEKGPLKTHRVHLSAGIERALLVAATNPTFREELTTERAAAAARAGIELTASERGVLGAIPEAQLQAAIDGVDVSADNVKRRSFLRAVAVSAAALSAGQPLGRCAREARAESYAPPKDFSVPKDVPQYYPDMGVRPSPDIGPDQPQGKLDITVDVAPPADKGARPDWDMFPQKQDIAVDVPGYKPDAGILTDIRPHDTAQRPDKGLPEPDDNNGGCNMAP